MAEPKWTKKGFEYDPEETFDYRDYQDKLNKTKRENRFE